MNYYYKINLHLISSFTFFSLNRRRIEKHMSQLVIHHPSHFYTFKVTNFHLASKKNLQAIVIIIKRHFWDDDDDIDTDLNFLTFFWKFHCHYSHHMGLCCAVSEKQKSEIDTFNEHLSMNDGEIECMTWRIFKWSNFCISF